MTKIWSMLVLAGSLALAAPAAAQDRDNDKGKEKNRDIPAAYRPAPGLCRVWLDDVPPGQQPAPTDCKTALKNRPEKARVIFGDDYVDKDRKSDRPLKGFQGGDKPPAPSTKKPVWRKP